MPNPGLSFHSAARSVAGSCFRLETDHGQILINRDGFQGAKSEEELYLHAFSFDPQKETAIDSQPAYIDYSALLPRRMRESFPDRVDSGGAEK
ncbi:hypothetical protein [uncultured Sulfitobacter sp.]|uniref:hypothetical protein n=1 Tax=uncultured Sulfitobacter sp. TaxID=191468 RepID=UPI00260A8310|nr:hypothetical protein [uncultured Sulfitobacter sp.]